MKEKLKQLKLLSKDVRDARIEKNNAELAMSSYADFGDDENVKQACLKIVNVTNEEKPLYIGTRCESFNTKDFCENTQCPNFDKNARYVRAYTKYKLARNVRKEFIKGLFIRSK